MEKLRPYQPVAVIDYALVATDHGEGVPAGEGGPIDVGNGVRLERLDGGLSERIFDATALRGENWAPTRQYACIQAYVREVWNESFGTPLPETYHWDHDKQMYPVIQLSRLIRDNATSTEFAARRVVHATPDVKPDVIVAFDGHESRAAYRLYPDQRGWLDAEEAAELRALVEAYQASHRARVGFALNRVDRAAAERYLEDALVWIVSGHEALLKVGTTRLTQQFAHRTSQLARALGFSLSYEQAEMLYDRRSAHVHAAMGDVPRLAEHDEFVAGFTALYSTLRAAVRRAIEEPGFAAAFKDDASVEERWPLPGGDSLARGLRRLVRRTGEPGFPAEVASWAGQLLKRAGADAATLKQLVDGLLDLPASGERLSEVLLAMGEDELAEIIIGDGLASG